MDPQTTKGVNRKVHARLEECNDRFSDADGEP